MFLAVITQLGEGCDYTIGCGQTVRRIDADNVADATAKILGAPDADGDWRGGFGNPRTHGPGGDKRLAAIALYEVASRTDVDLAAHWRACAQREADAASADAEQRERAEFDRLRAKYGSAT